MTIRFLLPIALASFVALSATAQESDPFAPAQGLSDGWEEMDQRLIFLMVRLVDVEANLEAIDKAMGKSKARAGIAANQANRAQAGNERMDRRAGGPVRWDKFYGTTAEKFFYHPTQNHTYHTETILSHQSPGRDNQSEPGVPSRQGLPVHQRPPQFDYMYRANETARQRAIANVAKFRGNAAALAARRHELQLEQSKLWCEVSFRAVARNDLDRKALYRFAPQGDGQEDLLAATHFVVAALSIVTNGQKDQASTFRQIKSLISKARYELGNKWLQLGVKYRDQSTDEWKFAALARRLEDVSANLGDSYTVSVERESAGDADRRDLYRGLLQQALLQYAETVLALDEMASEMAKKKDFKANLDQPFGKPSWSVAAVPEVQHPINTSDARTAVAPRLVRLNEITGHYPSLTKDGLTIVWEEYLDSGPAIFTAKRVNPDGHFTGRKKLFRGRMPALSADGLELVFLGEPNQSGVYTLHVAYRQHVNASFGHAVKIHELSDVDTPKSPFLSSDGLMLCFNRRGASGKVEIVFSTRRDKQAKWSSPKRLAIQSANMDRWLTWPSLTSDGLTLFLTHEGPKPNGVSGNLMIWKRSSITQPFRDYSFVEINGLPSLQVRTPRYVDATRELFFSAHPKASELTENATMVIKDFPVP